MKKLLLYIAVAMVYSFTMYSCIEEDLNDISQEKDKAFIELKISMSNGTETYSKAGSNTIQPDGSESGTKYENTIRNERVIDIFLFDNSTGSYLGKAEKLEITGTETDTERLIKGVLPASTIGKNVRLVFMANYKKRDKDCIKSAANKKYSDWSKSLVFDYGKVSWNPVEDAKIYKYIPMSGECTLFVGKVNYGHIQLVRAVAKVRIKVNEKSKYNITGLQTHNAQALGYCLKQEPNFSIPSNSQGLYIPLNFSSLTLTPGQSFEYYIPEQTAKQTQLGVTMSDGSANPKTVEFKYYPNGALYPIERNHLYEFVINKKADESKADIQVNIMPWVSHDINTNYE